MAETAEVVVIFGTSQVTQANRFVCVMCYNCSM